MRPIPTLAFAAAILLSAAPASALPAHAQGGPADCTGLPCEVINAVCKAIFDTACVDATPLSAGAGGLPAKVQADGVCGPGDDAVRCAIRTACRAIGQEGCVGVADAAVHA